MRWYDRLLLRVLRWSLRWCPPDRVAGLAAQIRSIEAQLARLDRMERAWGARNGRP